MLDSPLDIALIVTLWASVGGLAMAHGLDELLAPLRDLGVPARIAAFDVLVVPPATWVILTVLGVPEPFAIGLLLVGAASAGPLGVVAAQIARADTALALGLVAVLEIANAIAIPAWSAVLLPRSVVVPMDQVVGVLVLYVLAPVAAGLALRAAAPSAAAPLVGPARVVATVGLASVIVLVVAGNGHLLGPAAAGGVPVATIAIIALSLVGGWLVAGGPRPARVAGALVVAQRGSSVALAVSLTAFRDLPEASIAVVVYGMISLVVLPGVALALRDSGRDRLVAQPAP